MLKNLYVASVALLASVLLFSNCSKGTYSKDDTLTPQYAPSIIVGTDNHILYGLDPANGAQNWQVNFANSIFACPIVYGGYTYVGTVNYLSSFGLCDTLFKVNSQTGKIVKKISIPGSSLFSIRATPIAEGKYIYLATTNDSLYAIDTGTLAVKWRFGADGSLEASPAIYDNAIYIASTVGTVYSVKKDDGTLLWSYSAGPASSFTSSPAISFPYLYIGSQDSNMYCFYLVSPSAPTATPKWLYKTRGPIYSSPAVSAGKCIFGGYDTRIYCVDTQTAAANWVSTVSRSNIFSSPVVSPDNSLVYIGSNDNNLYALNINNGTVKWQYNTVGFISSSPLYYNGRVYVGSASKYFWAFDAQTGTVVWQKNVNSQMQCSPTVDDFTGKQHNSQVSGYTSWY
ncbi:MAG: hypothetical protein EBZ77_06780 [Chitinophagia bacterium]|nr:hypothetical protein [Chitinophagia bacterium]